MHQFFVVFFVYIKIKRSAKCIRELGTKDTVYFGTLQALNRPKNIRQAFWT